MYQQREIRTTHDGRPSRRPEKQGLSNLSKREKVRLTSYLRTLLLAERPDPFLGKRHLRQSPEAAAHAAIRLIAGSDKDGISLCSTLRGKFMRT